MKNIYLISQSINDDYDTHDSAVVIAESEEEARRMHPENSWGLKTVDIRDGKFVTNNTYNPCCTWCEDVSYVKVKLIGTANEDIEEKYICTSFNAG